MRGRADDRQIPDGSRPRGGGRIDEHRLRVADGPSQSREAVVKAAERALDVVVDEGGEGEPGGAATVVHEITRSSVVVEDDVEVHPDRLPVARRAHVEC